MGLEKRESQGTRDGEYLVPSLTGLFIFFRLLPSTDVLGYDCVALRA